MITAFIGDIHGCVDEFRSVSRRALQEADHVVFLGDYVDRGPDSRSVVEALVQLQGDSPNRTTFLRGNHDAAFLGILDDDDGLESFLRMGGAKTVRSYLEPPYQDALSRLRAAVPQAHRQFLESLGTVYDGTDVIAVHDPKDAPTDGRFVIAGHATQSSLVPLVSEKMALIDTGCGTRLGGRLTCFLWPTQRWWQSSD